MLAVQSFGQFIMSHFRVCQLFTYSAGICTGHYGQHWYYWIAWVQFSRAGSTMINWDSSIGPCTRINCKLFTVRWAWVRSKLLKMWNKRSSFLQRSSFYKNSSLDYQTFVDRIASKIDDRMSEIERTLVGMEQSLKSARWTETKNDALVFECSKLVPAYTLSFIFCFDRTWVFSSFSPDIFGVFHAANKPYSDTRLRERLVYKIDPTISYDLQHNISSDIRFIFRVSDSPGILAGLQDLLFWCINNIHWRIVLSLIKIIPQFFKAAVGLIFSVYRRECVCIGALFFYLF